MLSKKIKNSFGNFGANRNGNFAMMTAVLAPVVLMSVGLTLDVANQTALKGRLQSASDSVSIAVATRIAKGDLSIDDAEDFATQLLNAQMSAESQRFANLKITPQVTITEVENDGATTWDVKVGGTAEQDATPLASLFGKTTSSVETYSTAQTGTDEIQGALSLVAVVDVSGSMGGDLPDSQASISDIQDALDISYNRAKKVANQISAVMSDNDLDSWQVKWIAENYSWSDCQGMSTNATSKAYFLDTLDLDSGMNNSQTKKLCRQATLGSKFSDQETLAANIRTVISYYQPTKKIEALQDASAALFAQLNAADPTETYVRTGLSAYERRVRGTTNMEWGTASAQAYVEGTYASGGTASTNSVKWAYDQLKSTNSTENNAHSSKNGQTPDKFILFMTDGDNNRVSDDTSTKSYCDTAKADGIRIFSVAFAAPDRGQELLEYCASSADDYFDPETAEELIAAFEEIGSSTAKTLTRLVN